MARDVDTAQALTEADTSGEAREQDGASPSSSRLVNGMPIYYGWVIVAAATVGMIMTSPGQTYSVSIFIEHFIRDLGISRSLVSTLYTLGTLGGSLSLPFVGRQIDRRGPRIVVGVVTVAFGLACLYMGSVRNAIMLGLGFLLLRMLGQGSLSMVSSNVINRWWVRRRGMMLGIAGLAASLLGSGSFPSLNHALIGRFGWRTSYPLLGIMVLVVMLPVGLIFYRRQPEDYGLEPDGAPSGGAKGRGQRHFVEENWTAEEAVRTPAFWLLGLGLASISMLGTGLQFHMVSIFADSGLSAAVAAAAYLPISATGAIVGLSSGVLVDRIPARFLLLAALIGQAASLIMAPNLVTAGSALAYGIVLGTTSGLQRTVSSVVWPTYFGRKHLGAITGIASFVSIAGSALGPMPMGIARDMLGSYAVALPAAAVLPLALGVAALFARRPTR
jgi:MFS transporter, OFA family, oxalate/formate antiporter